MSNAALQHLAVLTLATTLAMSFVALARAPLRSTLGARAAYWLWLAVPASALASLLPQVGQSNNNAMAIAPDAFGWVWARMDALMATIHASGAFGAAACMVWAVGAGAALAFMILRQRTFARSLGTLRPQSDGTWRSGGVAEPMLLGALRPRVLVPLDFEARYNGEERELVLAHERAHMHRGDTLVNAFAAVWLCVFWFNPAMHWAMRLLRFDQDLACDATVLAAAGRGRRGRYAEALLKAQLAGEAALPAPLACNWGSAHPLRRRIAALRRPVAGRIRHGIGMVCVAALIASVSLATRAVQPTVRGAAPAARSAATVAAPAPTVHASGKVCPLSRRHAAVVHRAQPRA